MQYLCYFDRESDLYGEVIPELKLFFNKLQQIKRTLNTTSATPYLNRIQRERCKSNIYAFEELAKEFTSIENSDDFYLLHHRLQRYFKLHINDLKTVLGREEARRITLFVHY